MIRPASLMLYVMMFFLPVASLPASDETQIFQDSVFPYRISCRSEWVQEIKNDSMFQLKTTVSGKKTRFQLKRYACDTNGSREYMDWSRVSFAVSLDIAEKLGRVISFDSSISKKMGDLRTFELCALYLQTQAGDSIWWGELSRWTEYRSYGYYVAVITDTADLVKNYVACQELLDSVSITAGVTGLIPQAGRNGSFAFPGPAVQSGALHDLLGRTFTRRASGTQLQVQQHRKRPVTFGPGGR